MEVYETWLGQHSDNLQLCVLSTLWFLLTFFVVDLMKTFKKIAVRSTTTFRITLWTTQFERNDHDFLGDLEDVLGGWLGGLFVVVGSFGMFGSSHYMVVWHT